MTGGPERQPVQPPRPEDRRRRPDPAQAGKDAAVTKTPDPRLPDRQPPIRKEPAKQP